MKPEALIEYAKLAQKSSYSPYSHFAVGAALLTKSGKVYTFSKRSARANGISPRLRSSAAKTATARSFAHPAAYADR